MARNLSTYGIFPSMSALHIGAEALKAAGFRQSDISVLYSDRSGTKEFAHEASVATAAEKEADYQP